MKVNSNKYIDPSFEAYFLHLRRSSLFENYLLMYFYNEIESLLL